MKLLCSAARGLLLVATMMRMGRAEHIRLQSKFNPDHAIRMKEHKDGELCNGGTEHYTGWIDIGHKHLFYWYHPHRHHRSEAPLAIWLQGGPGGTSLAGAFMEHGPCLFSGDANATVFNKYSWTEEFNMLYIDQPVPAGFSYMDENATEEEYPQRTEGSAIDFVMAVRLVYEIFTERLIQSSTSLYLAGESYAGRWLPVYAAAVLDYNERALSSAQIPLASIMVGNGYSSPKELFPTLYEVACFDVNGMPSFMNESVCSSMENAVDRCETLLGACDDTQDELVFSAAAEYCMIHMHKPVANSRTNMYDRTMQCPKPGECYPEFSRMLHWMNSDAVLDALEIWPQTGLHLELDLDSSDVFKRFTDSGDMAMSSVPYLERILLSEQLHVLYYTGQNDWICNTIGVYRTIISIKWRGHARFRATPAVPVSWSLKDGRIAGTVKQHSHLTLAELMGGGHLYPMDQPESALSMVRAWLRETDPRVTIKKKVLATIGHSDDKISLDGLNTEEL